MTESHTDPTCNCENTRCQVTEGGHFVPGFDDEVGQFTPCPNRGTVPCRFVGQICEPCAAYMPVEYLIEARGASDAGR